MNSIVKKTYDREFKLKISQALLEKKVTTKRIAEEYNISRPTISRWVSEYRRYGKNAFAGNEKDYLIKQISTFLNRKING